MKRADRMRTRASSVTAPAVEESPTPPPQEPATPPQAEAAAAPIPITRSPDQHAIALIAKATKAMDWARAAGYAQHAIAKGYLNEQQVEQAIDAALPDPASASRLPLHRLMAVATAASPARQNDYIAAIKQYPGADQLPPDAQAQIADHLRLIGAHDA